MIHPADPQGELMPSTVAEVARTLSAGRLPGRLRVPCVPDDLPVAHATTVDGEVLVAARWESRAWLSIALSTGDPGATLTIEDVPPFPDSPNLGRVVLTGALWRVSGADLHEAGLRFADAHPIDDLLDLGRGVDLFRLQTREVHVEHCAKPLAVNLPDFVSATPDPLHADERELLADLRDHHGAELAALVPGSPRQIRPVRLDRYGLWLSLPALARIEFPRPAGCPGCVSRALRLDHARH